MVVCTAAVYFLNEMPKTSWLMHRQRPVWALVIALLHLDVSMVNLAHRGARKLPDFVRTGNDSFSVVPFCMSYPICNFLLQIGWRW